MKVLVTGASGQVGSYLCEFYLKKGWEVHGMVRQGSKRDFIPDGVVLHLQDIRDSHGMMRRISDLKPNVIHHMAAMSFVPYSWENPVDTIQTNVVGTVNILEAVKQASQATVVQFAGSSEEYGRVPPEEMPIDEDTKPRPASPYGVSKLSGDFFFQQYNRSYGLHTVITRTFNHDSPRRGDVFLPKIVALQGLEIKHGKRKCFTLGNMDAVRDYSDARDIVEAYYLSVTNPRVLYGSPYVVASGRGVSVRQVVAIASKILGIEPKTELDPERLRPSDIPVMIGNSSLFRRTTGWKPRYELVDTMKWMLKTLEAQLY